MSGGGTGGLSGGGRPGAYTAGEALDAFRVFPVLAFAAALPPGRLAVLAPHPDDESLGCGGILAEAGRRGEDPMVIVLTDGAASHPNSREYPAARLREVREAETLAAVAALGLPASCVLFLGYEDAAAPGRGAAAEAAAARLRGVVLAAGCATLLAPWRHDPHCDHEAAAAIARRAAGEDIRLLHYPVWGLTLPRETVLDGGVPGGFRIDISAHLARKRAAIGAHRSQYGGLITDDPDGFQMTEDFMRLFLDGTEIFLNAGA